MRILFSIFLYLENKALLTQLICAYTTFFSIFLFREQERTDSTHLRMLFRVQELADATHLCMHKPFIVFFPFRDKNSSVQPFTVFFTFKEQECADATDLCMRNLFCIFPIYTIFFSFREQECADAAHHTHQGKDFYIVYVSQHVGININF
jgi:lysylphosphatidylglycerol synthetase-like protein (DUF2156 family)